MHIDLLGITTLYSTEGVVHIEAVTIDGDKVSIEFSAEELLNDIPALYTLSQQALIKCREHRKGQFQQMIKDLQLDYKLD